MRKLVSLAALLTLVSCASAPACREMTWPDPTGGQAPPQHLGAEEAVLWSTIGWTVNSSVPVTDSVVTPCGDQLPCLEVVKRAAAIGEVRSIERCAVRWVPQDKTAQVSEARP